MRFIFKFPDIGEGISEGKILEWYVKKGQKVKSGDSLVKMETDKVVADIPSPKTGVIALRLGNPGDIIQVGDPLVELDIEGVFPNKAQEKAGEKSVAKTTSPVDEKGFGVVGTLEVADEGAYLPSSEEGRASKNEPLAKKALATPVARAMAKEMGIDIDNVTGTGPGNRVMKEDIQNYRSRPELEQAQGKSSVEIEELSQIRKTIAKRMTLSKQTIPHFGLHEELEVSSLVQLRNSQKQKFAERGAKLTYLAFVVKAAVEALKKYRGLNSQLDMEKGQIIYKRYYNIGIAVDAPDGLVVPVVRDVDHLSIYELARSIAELAQRARERKLTIKDLKDGTFSITSYGSLAGTYATPIINYPQAAILGVGRIREAPVVEDGSIRAGRLLTLSLSVDHRIVDGGQASRFLKDVKDNLTNPLSMLLD